MGQRYQAKVLYVGFSLFSLCGCSIWEAYSSPDYSSTRAERICHPYGDCSQGVWVSGEASTLDAAITHRRCVDQVNKSHGNGWWRDSVTHGLEIKHCMEENGYVLKQL